MLIVVSSGVVGRFLLRRAKPGTVWQKAFGHWHVFHIPLLYILVGSVLAHIYAVHAY
jgi:hypothetical protein